MRIFQLYLLLSSFSFIRSATSQETNSTTNYEILQYGLKRTGAHENAEAIVADRWNIRLKSVANCLITPQLKDSADQFNRRTDSLISLKHGKNWRKKFEKEIKKEERVIEKFILQIRGLASVSKLDSLFDIENNELYYLIFPLSNSRAEKKYEGFIYGWGTIDKKSDFVCYYKFALHKKRHAISLLSDKAYFLFNSTF